MVYRKKNISKPISFVILVFFFIVSVNNILAQEQKIDKKESLLNGLRQISEETMNLKDMRDIRFNKLIKDLDEFNEKGSKGVGPENDFYLLNPTNFSEEELGWGLIDTNLLSLEGDFRDVSSKVGINPILLMAMAKHETGNGTSELFKNKRNLFGFNAVDNDPYNMATDFKNERESIETVANHLKNEYLDKDGKYFNGVSTDGIGISYATDPQWSKKVDWMMIEVAKSMINVYEDYQ